MFDWQGLVEVFGRLLLAFALLWIIRIDIAERHNIVSLLKAKKVPWPPVAFWGAILLKFLAALSIAFHYHTSIMALLLGGFFFGATCLLQDFWRAASESERANKRLMFVIHMAIAGGLFTLV